MVSGWGRGNSREDKKRILAVFPQQPWTINWSDCERQSCTIGQADESLRVTNCGKSFRTGTRAPGELDQDYRAGSSSMKFGGRRWHFQRAVPVRGLSPIPDAIPRRSVHSRDRMPERKNGEKRNEFGREWKYSKFAWELDSDKTWDGSIVTSSEIGPDDMRDPVPQIKTT